MLALHNGTVANTLGIVTSKLNSHVTKSKHDEEYGFTNEHKFSNKILLLLVFTYFPASRIHTRGNAATVTFRVSTSSITRYPCCCFFSVLLDLPLIWKRSCGKSQRLVSFAEERHEQKEAAAKKSAAAITTGKGPYGG